MGHAHLLPQVISKEWIRDAAQSLVAQEAQPAFRARATLCMGGSSPATFAPDEDDDLSSLRGESGEADCIPYDTGYLQFVVDTQLPSFPHEHHEDLGALLSFSSEP